jgi:hypothetical protein
MKIGYAWVSAQEQDLDLQLDALTKEGCENIFQKKASGAQRDRPELKAALGYMRKATRWWSRKLTGLPAQRNSYRDDRIVSGPRDRA